MSAADTTEPLAATNVIRSGKGVSRIQNAPEVSPSKMNTIAA